MKVLLRERDLSDDYIRFPAQIGAGGFDIHGTNNIPGAAETGVADEQGMRALLDKLRRWGLNVYRVNPPTPKRYLLGESGGDKEVDDLCRTLEALGRAGVPFMSTPVHIPANPGYRGAAHPSWRLQDDRLLRRADEEEHRRLAGWAQGRVRYLAVACSLLSGVPAERLGLEHGPSVAAAVRRDVPRLLRFLSRRAGERDPAAPHMLGRPTTR